MPEAEMKRLNELAFDEKVNNLMNYICKIEAKLSHSYESYIGNYTQNAEDISLNEDEF
jgi:hypothetical protein